VSAQVCGAMRIGFRMVEGVRVRYAERGGRAAGLGKPHVVGPDIGTSAALAAAGDQGVDHGVPRTRGLGRGAIVVCAFDLWRSR
jgi:hypothetical protein